MAEIVKHLFGVLGLRWVRGRLRDLALGALLLIAVLDWTAFQSGFEAIAKSAACAAAHRYAALLPTVTAADSALPTTSYAVTKRNGFCTVVPKGSTTGTTGPDGKTTRLPSKP